MAYYYQKITFVFFAVSMMISSVYAGEKHADVTIVSIPEVHLAFTYQPLSNKEPKLDKYSFDALTQAAKLLKQDNPSAAIAELKIAIANKKNAALWYSLGQIQQQQQALGDAKESLKQALKLLPDFARAQQAFGAILAREGRHTEARTYLTRSLSTMPTAYVYSLIGYGYLQEKKFLAAQMAYQNAMVLDADNVQYQRGLLQASIASHDTSLAQAVLATLISSTPNDSKLWQLKANLALEAQHFDAATSALEVAEKLKSKIENRRLLAQIYLKQQQFKLAEPYLLSLLDKASYTDMQLISHALVFMVSTAPTIQTQSLMSKMWQIEGLQASVKSQLYLTEAQLALQKNNTLKARKALEKSIALNRQSGQALLLLARLLQTIEPMKAELLYRQAADIDEFTIRAKVEHAQLLIVQKSYVRAYDLLKEVQKLQPLERKHMDNLALVERLIATVQR